MKENLLIVWTNGDMEVANNFPLLYAGVVLEREYWKTAHLMLWGPSILLVKNQTFIKEKIKHIKNTGVKITACIVCVDDYGAKEELESLGIEVIHTGEFLTKALKDNSFSVLTI